MPILYLDVDDEITTAVSRMRTAAAGDVAIVLQAGSRIATSRINFRLLAREAQEHGRTLAIVTPDQSARALAATAGMRVFATVMEYEEAVADAAQGPVGSAAPGAEAGGRPPAGAAGLVVAHAHRLSPDELAARDAEVAGGVAIMGPGAAVAGGAAAGGAAAGGAAAGGAAAAREAAGAGGPAAMAAAGGGIRARAGEGGGSIREGARASVRDGAGGAAMSGSGSTDVTREMSGGRRPLDATTGLPDRVVALNPRRRRPTGRIIAAVLVLLALVAGGVAGYTVLPTATVTLEVRTVPVGPVHFPVHADVSVVEPDPVAGAIPAVSVDISLAASGTFKATGKRVEETSATGSVRWENCDPTQSYTIPGGTPVRTANGTAFQTREAVFLPVAILSAGSPPTITCQTRTIAIVAAKPGPAGNVPAGTISVVPGSYNSVVIRVKNLSPTSGGTHDEFPKIQQKDVDAALAALDKLLDEQLAAAAQAPEGLPDGAIPYPPTATRGEEVPMVDVAGLVGEETPQFDLSVIATGAVLAVDPSPIEAIGRTRLIGAVPAGHDLVAGSEQVTVGDGEAVSQEVTFQVTTSGDAVPRIDEAKVREAVRGKTADEARAALANVGDATITLWPDWTRTITTLDLRLEVRLQGLPSTQPGHPSGSPGISPSVTQRPPGSSPSPTPTASPVVSPASPVSTPTGTARPTVAPSASGAALVDGGP